VGEPEEARAAYLAAADLTANEVERRYLQARAENL
jgi:predicted RNA polymerase sigma factor